MRLGRAPRAAYTKHILHHKEQINYFGKQMQQAEGKVDVLLYTV